MPSATHDIRNSDGNEKRLLEPTAASKKNQTVLKNDKEEKKYSKYMHLISDYRSIRFITYLRTIKLELKWKTAEVVRF